MKRIILIPLACLLLSPIGGAFADEPAEPAGDEQVEAPGSADDEGGRPADSAAKAEESGPEEAEANATGEGDEAAPIDCSSVSGSPSLAGIVLFALIGLRRRR